MSERYAAVVIDVVDAPIFVTGRRFYAANVGRSLRRVEVAALETPGLVALTGPELVHGRIIAPFEDNAWDWMTANTGIYNVTDHEGRFGKKGAKVNVVAHGFGPLSHSQRIIEALKTTYTKDTGVVHLSVSEEKELLAPEGIQVYSYKDFLEVSEDPKFLKKNRVFGVLRDQNVLGETRHGVQPISNLLDNSTAIVLTGSKAQNNAYLHRAREKYTREDLGVHLYNQNGGYVLWLGSDYILDFGGRRLDNDARFVGGVVNAERATESPRTGDTPEKQAVAPSLEQVLALGRERIGKRISPVLWEGFEQEARKLYRN